MKKILTFIFLLLFAFPAHANLLPDADKDGVPDYDEINIYHTDPANPDTDGDRFNDWQELNNGYSPHNPAPVRLENNDADNDGLNDRLELKFRTGLLDYDSDGDGIKDGEEAANGYDPRQADGARSAKNIIIDTARQELKYNIGSTTIGVFAVSTGKPSMPTPKGSFAIGNKSPKAWSGAYGLWMPYWLGISGQKFGLHELPVWPNGYREGSDHLGRPVSHGCVRLGVGPAKTLYDWAEIGTPVLIN